MARFFLYILSEKAKMENKTTYKRKNKERKSDFQQLAVNHKAARELGAEMEAKDKTTILKSSATHKMRTAYKMTSKTMITRAQMAKIDEKESVSETSQNSAHGRDQADGVLSPGEGHTVSNGKDLKADPGPRHVRSTLRSNWTDIVYSDMALLNH
jgi:ribosomal protein L9